jgi:polar amino acid transport system substrate-binding protein
MVLTELDCQMIFVKMPWARSIVELKNGRVDIIDGAYKTAKRQRFAWYSDFTSNSYTTLFTRKENIDKYPLTNLQDIYKHKLRIGTQIGPLYADELANFGGQKTHLINPV